MAAKPSGVTDYALSELQAVLRGACRGVGVAAIMGDLLAEAVAYAPSAFSHWDELRAVFEEPVQSAFPGLTVEGDPEGSMRCLLDAPLIMEAALVSSEDIVVPEIDAPHILRLYVGHAAHIWQMPLAMAPGPKSGWRVGRRAEAVIAPPSIARVDLPEGLYAHLADIAARTFVPATEETRLSGAGAGLNDND